MDSPYVLSLSRQRAGVLLRPLSPSARGGGGAAEHGDGPPKTAQVETSSARPKSGQEFHRPLRL